MWKYTSQLAALNLIVNIFLFVFLIYFGVCTKESVGMLLLALGIFLFARYAKTNV